MRTSDYFNTASDLFLTDVAGSTVTRLTDTSRFLEETRSWLAT